MSLVSMRCPNCNGDISVDDSRDYGFCMYCGTKVMIRTTVKIQYDGVDSKTNLLNRIDGNISRHRFDEARKLCRELLEKYPETKLSDYGFLKVEVEQQIFENEIEIKSHNSGKSRELVEISERYSNMLLPEIELSEMNNSSMNDYESTVDDTSTTYYPTIKDFIDEELLVIDMENNRIIPQNKEVARYYANYKNEIFEVLQFDDCDEYVDYYADSCGISNIEKNQLLNRLGDIKGSNLYVDYKSGVDELEKRIAYLFEVKEKHSIVERDIRRKKYQSVMNGLAGYLDKLHQNEVEKAMRMKKSIPEFIEMVEKGDGIYECGGDIFFGLHGQLHMIRSSPTRYFMCYNYFDEKVKRIDEEGYIYITSRKEPLNSKISTHNNGEVKYIKYPVPRSPVGYDKLFDQYHHDFFGIKRCPFCLGKLFGDAVEAKCISCKVKFTSSGEILNKYKFEKKQKGK